MLQIAVCDGEAQVRGHLAELIKETVGCEVVLYSNGAELCEDDMQPDIVFLEVEKDNKTGIAIAAQKRKEDSLIIFISSAKDYVFDAFDVGAFHYLMKPLDEKKIKEVLLRAVHEKRDQEEKKPFIVKVNGSYYHIKKETILYVESAARKAVVHMKNTQLEFYAKMDDLEQELGSQFFRCHRGYLVNLSAVKNYETGSIQLKNGESILMAKQKYNDFAAAYTDYLQKNQ